MPETTTQEVDKTKQWEWTLKFMGYAINECSIAAYEACHTFTIWKDYNLKLVDRAEFVQMVADGKIAPPQTWWTVKPGQHGLVCKTGLVQYARDWENMSNCYQDFVKGWQACEKQQQLAASVPDKKSKTKRSKSNMPQMTQEHEQFLSNKNEAQVEHIKGCEQCFNFYLFGEGYRCKEYPAKHRIKNSDFARMIKDMPVGDLPTEDLRTAAKLLAERFNDPTITDETMDEVTIVPDDEWTKTMKEEKENK